jgi:hypothetical protein
MLRSKTKNVKRKMQNLNLKRKTFRVSSFTFLFCALYFALYTCSLAQEEFIYNAQGKRNPFTPLVTPDGVLLKLDKEEAKGDLLIDGIIYDKYGLSYALVNGEVVKIGDKVGDYQILKIEKNKVIFIKEGELTEVELKKEDE